MKTCPECRIEVGGNEVKCPLCGAHLEGEPEKPNWPPAKKMKLAANLYKTQFVLFTVTALAFGISNFNQGGLIVFLWVLAGEAFFAFAVRHYTRPGAIVAAGTLASVIVLFFSAFWFPMVLAAIPVLLMIVLIVSCFLTLLDRTGQSLIYFILTCIIFVATWIAAAIFFNADGNFWISCVAIAAASFLFMLVVNGKRMFAELKKKVSL